MLNAVVFGAFALIAFSFDTVEKRLSHVNARKVRHIAGLVAVASHPATIHTLQDYAVHLLIYSGYIIPGH
jgi:hypothetical protein